MLLKIRLNQKSIQEIHAHDRGRLLVITGARQTGKSTLARMAFPDYDVVNLDSPVERALYERWAPAEWISRYPRAVIDEAQKLPAIFDTIKACYDRNPDVRYVLLGSSQILLMKGVRETLAGRAALRELFPFSLPELVAEPGIEPVESRLVRMLRAASPMRSVPDLFLAD
ncbi:MAG: AAA family ATPase, partial [Proteobacteria bacterium]|nr:AAA family ATPase [Pseudomonadota bacterium]